MYQYRNRYYHAQLGRFVSRDPIGYQAAEWNLYGYVQLRPLIFLDPMGLQVKGKPRRSDTAVNRPYSEAGKNAADGFLSGILTVFGLDVAKDTYEYVSGENAVTGNSLGQAEQAQKGTDAVIGGATAGLGILAAGVGDLNRFRKLSPDNGLNCPNPKWRIRKIVDEVVDGESILEYTIENDVLKVDWVEMEKGKNAVNMLNQVLDLYDGEINLIQGYTTDKLGSKSDDVVLKWGEEVAKRVDGGWKPFLTFDGDKRFINWKR